MSFIFAAGSYAPFPVLAEYGNLHGGTSSPSLSSTDRADARRFGDKLRELA